MRPPRLAGAPLSILFEEGLSRESLLGVLEAEYHLDAQRRGRFTAAVRYWGVARSLSWHCLVERALGGRRVRRPVPGALRERGTVYGMLPLQTQLWGGRRAPPPRRARGSVRRDLLAAGRAACLIPALRAARIDPLMALRAE